ncbi:hypothetical protein ALC56_07971, partial [Trachymyrmex septentrionalis]
GTLAFKNIADFVLIILSLPILNATVERIFSIMNATKDKIRNKIGTEMLNAILMIKAHSHTNNYCCKDFVNIKDMFKKIDKEKVENKEDKR